MQVSSVEGITEYRLENGLKVLLFPDSSKPTVTVNLTVFVGSRHEGYGEAGMAHLLEHMLFKGTPTFPSIPKALQARGAEFNGTTWLDRTNYFETLPAEGDNLEFAIRLEADRMVNSLIRSEDLASEMTVVRNEFERGENNPQYVLFNRMMGAAYEWHNYGKTTIGNRADIERVPVENLREFYRKYYQPDNAMLVVAGKFDPKVALPIIGEAFGKLPKPDRILPNTYTEEPAQDGERVVTLRRVGDVAVVGVVYHIPAGPHPDWTAIDVLETVLTLAPSGRLYKALVEQKKAASVSGAAFALHDPGVMRLLAEVAAGNTPDVVLETMLETIDQVVERGVTAEEVDRAKTRLLKQRELAAADTAELAVELSEWAAQGDWRLYFLYRDRLEQVTPADVHRVAKTYLLPVNRTVGMFIPTEQSQRAEIPATPAIEELVGGYQGREDLTAGEEFDVSPLNIEERTTRTKVGSIDAAFLPKQNRGSTVVFRLTLRYGSDKSLFGMSKACEFLAPMMARGTRQLNRQQIQDALDQNLATLQSSSSAGEITFVIQTKKDKLPAVLGILKQVLREPTFPGEELEILRQQSRADLEQNQTEPQTLALRSVSQILNPYPAGDVRHTPTIAAELEALAALDVRELRKLHTEFLGNQAGQLCVVGDFDADAISKQVGEILQGWTAKQPYVRISRTGDVKVSPEVKRIDIADKANAFYFAGGVMPMNDQHQDYPALAIGNYVFGAGALSSRLGDRIRQKEGLSYGVGSMLRASTLDQRTTLSLYAICNPENVEKVHQAMQEEWARWLEDGVTEDELTAAQQGYLQRQQVARTEDPFLARLLEESLYAGRTLQFNADLETAVQQLTTDSVKAAIRRHFGKLPLTGAFAGTFKTPLKLEPLQQ